MFWKYKKYSIFSLSINWEDILEKFIIIQFFYSTNISKLITYYYISIWISFFLFFICILYWRKRHSKQELDTKYEYLFQLIQNVVYHVWGLAPLAIYIYIYNHFSYLFYIQRAHSHCILYFHTSMGFGPFRLPVAWIHQLLAILSTRKILLATIPIYG